MNMLITQAPSYTHTCIHMCVFVNVLSKACTVYIHVNVHLHAHVCTLYMYTHCACTENDT